MSLDQFFILPTRTLVCLLSFCFFIEITFLFISSAIYCGCVLVVTSYFHFHDQSCHLFDPLIHLEALIMYKFLSQERPLQHMILRVTILNLVLLYALFIGYCIQFINWTEDVDFFLGRLPGLMLNGDDSNQLVMTKGLAEALLVWNTYSLCYIFHY